MTGPASAETATSSMGSGVSESHMGGEVSSCVFVTLGYRQLKGSCRFAPPQSESVFSSSATVCVTLGW